MTETVSATGLNAVYEAVFTASGTQETGWQAVNLDANGNASFQASLQHTGDRIEAVDNTANPSVVATSSPIVITDPPAPTIALTGPGTGQETSVGAGITVTETVSATGLNAVHGDMSLGERESSIVASRLNSASSSIEAPIDVTQELTSSTINHGPTNKYAAAAFYATSDFVHYGEAGPGPTPGVALLVQHYLSSLEEEGSNFNQASPNETTDQWPASHYLHDNQIRIDQQAHPDTSHVHELSDQNHHGHVNTHWQAIEGGFHTTF